MERLGIEERAYFSKWPCQLPIRLTVNRDGAVIGTIKAKNHPHGGRFAAAIGSEEAGDDPWLDGETQIIDRNGLAVSLGEASDANHRELTGTKRNVVTL